MSFRSLRNKTVISAVALISFFTLSSAQADSIRLPRVGAQQQGWTCGQNSAARVLEYYGVSAALESLLECPKSVDMYMFKAGPSPWQLAQCMNALLSQPQFEVRTDIKLGDVAEEISRGRPVILLLRSRQINLTLPWLGAKATTRVFGFGGLAQVLTESRFARENKLTFEASELPTTLYVPGLHYIVVNGWDVFRDSKGDKSIEFTYVEPTDDREHRISYSDLLKKWDFQEESPFFQKILGAVAVTGKMAIVVKPLSQGWGWDWSWGVFRRLSPKL